MNAVLPAAQRARFVKVMGLLSSDQAGERAAAAWKATQMLEAAGLTWEQIVMPAQDAAPEPAQVRPTQPSSPTIVWAQKINGLLCRTEFLTEWELRFISGIAVQHRLTAKQVEILLKIHQRVVLWEAG